jgi:NSS family neurotransmitter:Na+ symporter
MSEPSLLEEQRENWGSRAGFVLAAIGSAVGLGNLWGFPYKLYSYGGGAFLIPYIIAMLIIGVPVLILEFSVGHMTQRAAPEAFRGLGRKKEPIGWWGIILGFVIITYYPVILAWCLSFLWYSVEGIIWHGGVLPWTGPGSDGVARAADFFLHDYCDAWQSGQAAHPWLLGTMSSKVVFSLCAMWVLMFLCIFRGVKSVSKVVFWTVPLPWLMLLILTVRGLTLDGASAGLAYYLNPDWSQLAKPTTWRFAFGQVFFSMSLAFGVMLTYASFLHRKSDINNNAAVIGLGDLGTSFVAGIAVFATLGAMSVAASVPVDGVISEGTVGLSFIAFPYALAQLPYSAYFGVVFFLALITLGIDSAFSITESVLASLVDKTGWHRTATLMGLSFVGLCAGLVYCSRGGLDWLENIDGFINGPWGISLLGLLECVVLGWMYRITRLRQHANERSDWRLGVWWDWNIRIVVPVTLSALFAWSLYDTMTNPAGYLVGEHGELLVPTLVGLVLAALAPILSVILSCVSSRTSDGGPSPHAEQATVRQTTTPLITLAGVLAVVGSIGAVFCTAATIRVGLEAHQMDFNAAVASAPIRGVLIAVICLSAAAAAIGAVSVTRAEKRGLKPSKSARMGGGLGVMAGGMGLGLMTALWVLVKGKSLKPMRHSTEMTAQAYVIMAVMLTILVVGLGWCFYKAMKASGGAETPQNEESLAGD